MKATGIVITDLKGSEGLNKVVNYPGYGAHFRTQGSGTLTVYGVLTATDSSTGVTYAVGESRLTDYIIVRHGRLIIPLRMQ